MCCQCKEPCLGYTVLYINILLFVQTDFQKFIRVMETAHCFGVIRSHDMEVTVTNILTYYKCISQKECIN